MTVHTRTGKKSLPDAASGFLSIQDNLLSL